MLNKIILSAVVAALAALLTPSEVHAYGAAHVGYTHVGPAGVYHTGATVAAGPRGVYETGRTSATGYGGSAYRAGYGGAEYRYAPTYYGGASAGAYRYGYVR